MLYLLGLLCVSWTVHELVNLHRRSLNAHRKGPPASPGFVAWDDSGHSVRVEEMRRG